MRGSEGYAVVSCHVERPLDDEVWRRYRALIAQRPGGFPIASLMRPPADGEDASAFLERAREAAALGPLGHHTHWTSPTHARPTAPEPAAAVRREGAWLREQGLEARFFCGGGWYTDAEVMAAVADLGYADCTATAWRPSYLPPGSPRAALAQPAWVRLDDGRRVLELPTTHSLGAAAKGLLGPLPAGRSRPLPRLRAARDPPAGRARLDSRHAVPAPPAGRARCPRRRARGWLGRRMRRLIAVAAVAALAGCGSAPAPSGVSVHVDANPFRVTILRDGKTVVSEDSGARLRFEVAPATTSTR